MELVNKDAVLVTFISVNNRNNNNKDNNVYITLYLYVSEIFRCPKTVYEIKKIRFYRNNLKIYLLKSIKCAHFCDNLWNFTKKKLMYSVLIIIFNSNLN